MHPRQVHYITYPFILLHKFLKGSDIMTTAIYARQSINKKDSISIETQIDICKKEIYDNSNIKIYTDKGFSGKNTSRPDFQQLIADVRKGQIQRIVVYRLDRISRSVVDFANIIDVLNEHNVDFISANEKFDTSSPIGKAMLYIVMVFAQLERETIAERIRDNYYQRGTDGVWLGGQAPFGYENIKTTFNGKKVATIKETKDLKLVEWIYQEYVKDGVSLGQIASQLVSERNEMWNNIKLSRILHNPAYVMANADIYNYFSTKGCIIESDVSEFNGINGLNVYGKRNRSLNKYNNITGHHVTVGMHKGVIPAILWLQCQQKLSSNVQIKNNGKGKHTWLTGLVKCGYCEKAMVVRSYKDTKYFNCSGRAINMCDGERSTQYVNKIEDIVSEKIKKYVKSLKNCKLTSTENKNESEINAIKINLVKVNTEIDNIVKNLSSANEIMMRYANEKIIELDNQKNELLNKLNALNIKKERKLNIPDVSEWDISDNMLKKDIANRLIEKVYIFADRVEILWKC